MQQILKLIEEQGIMLESAKGSIPNLADKIAGEKIKGSWWGHPKGNLIYHLLSEVRKSEMILVCRFIKGKITFIHKNLWSALVKLAPKFDSGLLDKVVEIHTTSGKHKVEIVPFPQWVPAEIKFQSEKISEEDAMKVLPEVIVHYILP